MSRVVKAPVVVSTGIDVKIDDWVITIRSKGDELTRTPNDVVEVKHTDNTLTFGPRDGYADGRARAGTVRALPNSVVTGITEGFTGRLQLVGIGYRVVVKGNVINLSPGFSHPVGYQLPAGITTERSTRAEIMLKGADRQMIDWVVMDLRTYRCPKSYKSKGVRCADEVVCTKEAKRKQGNTTDKKSARIRRATCARRKLQELGTARLMIHRTSCHIYAQVIASNGSKVLVVASTVEKAIAEQLKHTGNRDAATVVDKAVVKRALEKSIKDVSFSRSGFQCYGRAQTLADTAREVGLQF